LKSFGTLALLGAFAGCPSPQRPTPPAGSVTLEIGRAGGSLRGVAGDGETTYAAITIGDRTTLEARRGSSVAWQAAVAGSGGPVARTRTLLVAAIAGEGTVADLALRGGPGVVVVALDAASGAPRWRLAIDSSEWSLITAIAPAGEDVVVGGSFSGTLRAAAKVVSSAGKSDGFVARITAKGEVAWLVRTGGAWADAVQGVAVAGDRIAIAGTFATGAELLGEPLVAFDDNSPKTDVFVAELGATGLRKWSASFGGKLDDSVAGVAIDGKGRIAVAATARETLHINVADIVAQGPADGLVTFFSRDGTPGPTVVLGGPDFDGLRAIVASGEHVVVGGFYAGTMLVGPQLLRASGSDDAFLAALDGGSLVKAWPISGSGREEITALAPVPGGFIAGLAHTAAASIDGQPLPAPKDPMSGAALVVRAVR